MTTLRICIIVDALNYGGAEKSAANLSLVLSNAGYLVSIVSIQDAISYSYGGHLFNLGTNVSSVKLLKQFQKLNRLRNAIKHINPHYILDYRMRHRRLMELVLYTVVLRKYSCVYTVHNHAVYLHLPKGLLFKTIYNKNTVVAVSKGVKHELETNHGLKHVHYIPNGIDKAILEQQALSKTITDNNYIIAIGRLENSVKQFDKLIETYTQSELPKQRIKLYILGSGPDMPKLQMLIRHLGVEDDVLLMGFVPNPYPYLVSAKFLVLSSKYEGFSMVILEALALKTPVVAFDCKSGPSELITHNKNGLLVEDQNFEALKAAINYLTQNTDVLTRLQCTNISLDNYYNENQLKLWQNILR